MTEWTRPADNLRDEATRVHARIRNNKALSPDAKKAMMAQALLNTRQKMADLEGTDKIRKSSEQAVPRRRLFGIEDIRSKAGVGAWGSIDMSWRNAQDLAESIKTDNEARTLLRRAEDTGDELLARAVGNHMLNQHLAGFTGMDAPLADYLSVRPNQAAALEAVKSTSVVDNSMAAMWEYVVPVPDDLGGLNETQIEQLAAQADAYRAAV